MPQVINGTSLNTQEGFDKVTSTDKVTAGYHRKARTRWVGITFTFTRWCWPTFNNTEYFRYS